MRDLENLRVCLIAGTLGQGGAERQLFYIVQSLITSGAKVQLLCLTRGEFWESKINRLGLQVKWVGEHNGRARRIGAIIRALRNNPPDVIQSQHFYTNLYAVAAARVLGCREIGAVRNDCVSEVKANGRVFGRLSLWAPRAIAANSRTAIRHALEFGVARNRVHLLTNVVDTEKFIPVERSGTGSVRLVLVGRLEPQKRVDRFLSVLSILTRLTSTPIKVMIVGDGSQRSSLEAQSRALGLSEIVEFRGAISDVTSVYQSSDILVLTSDYEGTPNVALEAMASGLVVVATRTGGIEDVIEDGSSGYLLDADQETRMAAVLAQLVNNPVRRREIGTRATAFVREHHSPAILPAQLQSIYSATL